MKDYTLLEAIETIHDPRRQASCWYPLSELCFQIFVAVLCNASTFPQIRLFVSTHWEWFLNFIPMVNGLPDESVYRRTLAIIDSSHMHKMFTIWMRNVIKKVNGLICIDGKTIRGSKTASKKPTHVVSALCETRRQIIAQVAVQAKSNEIKAIPQLLDMLAIRGCIVTLDALGTQYSIARKIYESGAFYLLPLKDNQRWLQKLAISALQNVIDSVDIDALPTIDVEYTIMDPLEDTSQEQEKDEDYQQDTLQDQETDEESETDAVHTQDIPCSRIIHLIKENDDGTFAMSKEEGHGRVEIRKAYVCNDVSWLSDEVQEKWGKPIGVGVIFKETKDKKTGKITESVMWFIHGVPNMTAKKLLLYRRGHWSVEVMHNTLDVVFDEDACHASWENIAENLNVIRQCAQNALKQEKTVNGSVAYKRFYCCVNEAYLNKVLATIGIYPTRIQP